MSKKWMGLCSMAVALMMATAGGCAQKESEEAAATAEEVVDEMAASSVPSAAGMYAAELPAADTPGRSVMLMLNGDNTASMSVDYMNGQPAVVENGSWVWNAVTSAVDVTLQRDVSGTMVSSMMSFTLDGDTLSLNNPADAGYGEMGIKLVKSAAGHEGHGDEGHSHEGHSH
jgi:uncharacterized lipoprotein NlpE involved in copper resistance